MWSRNWVWLARWCKGNSTGQELKGDDFTQGNINSQNQKRNHRNKKHASAQWETQGDCPKPKELQAGIDVRAQISVSKMVRRASISEYHYLWTWRHEREYKSFSICGCHLSIWFKRNWLKISLNFSRKIISQVTPGINTDNFYSKNLIISAITEWFQTFFNNSSNLIWQDILRTVHLVLQQHRSAPLQNDSFT